MKAEDIQHATVNFANAMKLPASVSGMDKINALVPQAQVVALYEVALQLAELNAVAAEFLRLTKEAMKGG